MSFSDARGGYDAAPNPQDADLSGFDSATGITVIPPGKYPCTVVRGELTSTKTGKLAYVLTIDVSDGPHTGHRLWRYCLLDNPAAINRSKAILAGLGLKSSADLKAPFPPFGAVVRVAAIVGLQRNDPTRNEVERIELIAIEKAPSSPFAVDLNAKEGGTP